MRRSVDVSLKPIMQLKVVGTGLYEMMMSNNEKEEEKIKEEEQEQEEQEESGRGELIEWLELIILSAQNQLCELLILAPPPEAQHMR